MNESFMRKIYEAGPELDENMMQQGLNFYGQQFKNLIQTFPGTDAPIFLAAPFRPPWKKLEEPKAAPGTSLYLPRAVELTMEQHKPEEGLRVLLEGFAHYFNCIAEALGPYPMADTAMLIMLHRHIAASLAKQDPAAAQMADELEKTVKLPPVDFYAASKK